MNKESLIVAFAFGTPGEIQSNRRLAEVATKLSLKHDTQIYTQLDIDFEKSGMIVYTDEIPGFPPSTLRIARGAVKWAEELGRTKIWIVAAGPHLWRVLRDVTRSVAEAEANIEVDVCEEITYYPEDSWFCQDSTQTRTRTRKAWYERERILKLMPFFVYKRIAG